MSALSSTVSALASAPLLGAIEAGGTKFVCAVGTGAGDVVHMDRFYTERPRETLESCVSFFETAQAHYGKIAALGVGAFGPVDLQPRSPTYGHITTTPKEGWADTDVVGTLSNALGVPVGFDTDVNAAALGEGMWGAAQKLANYIYLTVGTGIGGAAVVNGGLVHGLIHPEMGHIFVPREMVPDIFRGACIFHGDCLEGLASGPSMKARWGMSANELPEHHRGWQIEANYLALACYTFLCTYSPERIILGGGVMKQEHLFPKIRARFAEVASGYFRHPTILNALDAYIVPPALGDMAGVMGGFLLARKALEEVGASSFDAR